MVTLNSNEPKLQLGLGVMSLTYVYTHANAPRQQDRHKPAFTPVIIGVNDSLSICPSDGNSIIRYVLTHPQYCDD